ncbi:hypothetical protein BASA60_005167 [Batrachochytrium salamandrivorans]|nr:hypothetical protein BASA60_005167 [Batrachochytrium salamandrivorans]
MTSDDFKAQGNKAFSSGEFESAIKLFSQAIDLDPSNHVLYSNRSAAYASLHNYTDAVTDANKTIELRPDWVKGYSRKGAALHGLGQLDDAVSVYQEGLKIEPENALLKRGLSDVESTQAANSNPMAKIFGPGMWEKITANPRLSPFLAQPDLVEKLRQIQANPEMMNVHLKDTRVMEVLMGLMDLDGRVATSAADAEMAKEDAHADLDSRNASYGASSYKPTPKSQPAPPPVPELSAEEMEKKNKRTASDEAKSKGNAAYKLRQFEEALTHYATAWEQDNTNVAVLTNKAAVLFEMERYTDCIKACEEAVEVGREQRVDYKLIARAFGRIGTSYTKLNDYPSAIKHFQKSLAEHRTADVLEKLRDAEKILKKNEEESYKDPALSDVAREAGNELFKKHDYVNAIKQYTDAIKRNPEDPRNFSNRAACYTKLMALPEADKDCDLAIKLDPGFLKAYIRKAAILFAKRDFMTCIEMCEEIMTKDTEGKHTSEVQSQSQKAYYTLSQLQSPHNREDTLTRAKQNPDVVQTMSDPIMQTILKQMQEDPSSVRAHMANPAVAGKIRVLINAGIVSLQR